ncbi:MAG: PepSY domain-containing protein [Pseudomonadota bacterium]
MKLRQLLSWRFSLIFFHRWLGILVGLMLVAWSISAVVLLYYGIPHYTAGERLDRLRALDLGSISITPQEALAKVGGTPFRLRISMHEKRPVYRINTGTVFGNWTMVYADTGEVMNRVSRDDSIFLLADMYPEFAANMSYEFPMTDPDMFTHSPGLQNYMPMHRIAINDDADTRIYVAEKSGDIVMRTDNTSRFFGFMGYNLHTLFFFRQASWWTPLLSWLSWIGLIMTVLGLVLGIWRFSRKPIYIKRGDAYRTPYVGWWRWHHYAGLIFGALMLTWVLSGLVSIGQIPGFAESAYTTDQINAGARTLQGFGAATDFAPLSISGIQHAADAIGEIFPIKELELLYQNGVPYFLAYRAPTEDELTHWVSRSALDFNNLTLEQEHRFIAATGLDAQPFVDFSEAELLNAAARAMPDAAITEQTWLTEFDDYYYYTISSFDLGLPRPVKTLPVLRLKYDDPNETWLYLTPSHGQMLKLEAIDRRNRWGYYGLHGLDFAALYNNRPLWDIVVIFLLLGCLTLSVTTLVPMFRRVKRHFFRLLHVGRWLFPHDK